MKADICDANSEKLLKLDAKRREYDVVVIGEEPHLAYNRVGLTSFFQHRKVENLYLNPQDWVSPILQTEKRCHVPLLSQLTDFICVVSILVSLKAL